MPVLHNPFHVQTPGNGLTSKTSRIIPHNAKISAACVAHLPTGARVRRTHLGAWPFDRERADTLRTRRDAPTLPAVSHLAGWRQAERTPALQPCTSTPDALL